MTYACNLNNSITCRTSTNLLTVGCMETQWKEEVCYNVERIYRIHMHSEEQCSHFLQTLKTIKHFFLTMFYIKKLILTLRY